MYLRTKRADIRQQTALQRRRRRRWARKQKSNPQDTPIGTHDVATVDGRQTKQLTADTKHLIFPVYNTVAPTDCCRPTAVVWVNKNNVELAAPEPFTHGTNWARTGGAKRHAAIYEELLYFV